MAPATSAKNDDNDIIEADVQINDAEPDDADWDIEW